MRLNQTADHLLAKVRKAMNDSVKVTVRWESRRLGALFLKVSALVLVLLEDGADREAKTQT